MPYLRKSREGCGALASAVALDTRFHRLRGQSEATVGAGARSALVNAGETHSYRVSADARIELSSNERESSSLSPGAFFLVRLYFGERLHAG